MILSFWVKWPIGFVAGKSLENVSGSQPDIKPSWVCFFDMGVSTTRGAKKWTVYNGKPNQNRWFGGTPIFGNTHMNQLRLLGQDQGLGDGPTVPRSPTLRGRPHGGTGTPTSGTLGTIGSQGRGFLGDGNHGWWMVVMGFLMMVFNKVFERMIWTC